MIAQTLEQVMQEWASSNRPIVKPELYRGQRRKWTVQLVEVWPNPIAAAGPSGLDEKVEWAYQTLKTWKSANRTAWDMWMFDSKNDAEKFITLYTLVWAE